MRKMIVIAVREYQAAVRTKAFIISLLALPVIWAHGLAVLVGLLGEIHHRHGTLASRAIDRLRASLSPAARS